MSDPPYFNGQGERKAKKGWKKLKDIPTKEETLCTVDFSFYSVMIIMLWAAKQEGM